MRLLTLDFETYYDSKYSLKTLTYIEYVHDPRFHVHGLAIRHPDGRCEFCTDVIAALKELQKEFGQHLENVTVLFHNAYFDAFVLSRKYGIRVTHFIDSMLLSRHVYGNKGEGGESASLKEVAKRLGLEAKGDLSFMLGVRSPNPVQLADLTRYATNDVEISYNAACALLRQVTRPDAELRIMAHTVRLFTERSILIDRDGLKNLDKDITDETDAWLREAYALNGDLESPEKFSEFEDAISKNDAFANLMTRALARTNRLLPLKKGTKGLIPATAKKDQAMLELLEDDDPVVQALAHARIDKKSTIQLKAKLATLDRLAEITNGELPIFLNYGGAHTGRFSGGQKFNLQNMGKDKWGAKVRNLLISHPGQSFVLADLAQIEARVLAWLAGQQDLLEAFAENRDIYSEFATSEIFHTTIRKTTKDEPDHAYQSARRQVGKQAVLGLGFSMGAMKFMNTLRSDGNTARLFKDGTLTPSNCPCIVKSFRRRFSRIKDFWEAVAQAFKSAINGGAETVGVLRFYKKDAAVRIELPSGRILRYANARFDSNQRTIRFLNEDGDEDEFVPDEPSILYGNGKNITLYGGKIAENIVQAVARDIFVDAILELERRNKPVLFHVHDEVIIELPYDDIEAAANEVKQVLETAPDWINGLPLAAEVSVTKRYEK